MANPALVRNGAPNVYRQTKTTSTRTDTEEQPTTSSSLEEVSETDCFQNLRQTLEAKGISEHTASIIMSSWRDSTKQQYRSYLTRWLSFCSKHKEDPLCPSSAKFLDFLTGLYEQGVGYSAINTAKSAVSSFLNVSSEAPQLGNNPIVKRFMAGVFNQRPALPRYNVTWDVSVVLNYLRTQSPVRNLTLLALAQKLAMLFLFLSGHRGQSLVLLDIRNIRITKGNLKVTFGDVMKHTRPGTHTAELTLPGYAPDRRLCIVTTYSEYVLRTKSIRRSHTLFIGTIRPHSPVSKDTVAKRIKKVMSVSDLPLLQLSGFP